MDSLKAQVLENVDEYQQTLIDISHRIHERPELGFEERFAHDLLTDALEDSGFDVERHACGLETAFRATIGSSGPRIAVMCEYDALPEIGHACGHNVIAAAGLGASLALRPLVEQLQGQLVVLGTPAEEGGGGKIIMAKEGALAGLDAAMMIHPSGQDLCAMSVVAIERMRVAYEGRAAHAAAAPQRGRNALDAAVLGYVNIAALRQHIESSERVHGVFTHGGTRPTIVPQSAVAEWYVRAPSVEGLHSLVARVDDCLDAGAQAAGCSIEREPIGPTYPDMVRNGTLEDLYSDNSAAIGREVHPCTETARVIGSTDMGYVSYEVPSLHPMIKIAPESVSLHSPEFTEHARSPQADAGLLDGARAMAFTAIDLWKDPSRIEGAKAELARQR